MRRELFQPTEESEARLLLLIATFSSKTQCLEGRTKLAKLDFLLRYPRFLRRALEVRNAPNEATASFSERDDIESRMVRYRYGPWDPAYYAVLGRLLGKRLIEPVPFPRGIGYRATTMGTEVVARLSLVPDWALVAARTRLLKRHLNLSGTSLTKFVYRHFPEVTGSSWGERL